MNQPTVRTRFAPSPTGALHIGNARTALFNWLFARHHGGRFILRSEDTDRERSSAAALDAIESDLDWLGLDRDEGPDIGGAAGPYRQSERTQRYRDLLERLLADDLAYPCYCTREELAESRRRQQAAGRAPRYAGTCARLTTAQRRARQATGREPTIRFRVPDDGEITFQDRVHGHQAFRLATIGDFVIARPDGMPAFFFANAVDDADMSVTDVLRGDDHLTNTPRQLLLLRALDLPEPAYGHFGLITDTAGQPLSKRQGGARLADLRDAGYRAEAVRNHLARVGLSGMPQGLLTPAELAVAFDPGQISRGPAVHDVQALDGWQRRAVDLLDAGDLLAWLDAAAAAADPRPPAAMATAFARAVQPNVLFPREARQWAAIVFGDAIEAEPEAGTAIAQAGSDFFRQALAIREPAPVDDFRAWAKKLGKITGRSGRHLFRPLRAALTGRLAGPELAEIVPLMGHDRVETRLRQARETAGGP